MKYLSLLFVLFISCKQYECTEYESDGDKRHIWFVYSSTEANKLNQDTTGKYHCVKTGKLKTKKNW